MARINWQGIEYRATPIRQVDDQTWLMRMEQHGARFVPGTEVHVKTSEVIEMAAAETPPAGGFIATQETWAEIDAAMAAERKTLPTVQELLGKARKDGTINNPKPVEVA